MTISENIELPKLTVDEAWLDKSDTDLELSEAVKRLLYLPNIAYKTAVYNNNNELSKYQKDRLLLLFIGEAEQAFNEVHNQVLLMVGNAPTDRLDYFKDFESWKERLVELVKKSLDCLTKKQFLKEIEEITNTLPSKEQLAIEGKLTTKGIVTVEGKNQFARILDYLTKRGKEKVFDECIYFNKFSKFTIEACHLLRRFSVMHSITTENIEWAIKGLENIGKLPEIVKVALEKTRCTSKISAVTKPLEKVGDGKAKSSVDKTRDIKKRFSFNEAQALFDNIDLGLPSGETVSILKKLLDSFGEVVKHNELDQNSNPSNASDILKGRIHTIKRALKRNKIPCRIESKRGVGYVLKKK